MAIKMRNNTNPDSICCECGETRRKVLDMFDVKIGGNIFTICDVCNEALFYKTLRAECYKNGRVKSKEDMAIIHSRKQANYEIEELHEKLKKQEKQKGETFL